MDFSWFFVFCSSLKTLIRRKIFRHRKTNKDWNISRSTYFKGISMHYFKDLICTYKLEEFFFKKNFLSRTGSFLHESKALIWASVFAQKIKIDFTLLNKSLKNLKFLLLIFKIKNIFKWYFAITPSRNSLMIWNWSLV